MDLLNNTVFLLFLTFLLVLTVYPYTWLKFFFVILTIVYGIFLGSTEQYVFLFSLLVIGLSLLYNLLKSVFHLF